MSNNKIIQERIEIILNKMKIDFQIKEELSQQVYLLNDEVCFLLFEGDLIVNVGEKDSFHLNDLEGVRLTSESKHHEIGFLTISPEGLTYDSDIKYWIKKSVDYNKKSAVS